MNAENIINGLFRPVIGFFIGMVLAYIFQLAQSAGWIFATGWLVFLVIMFGAVMVFDNVLRRIGDKVFGGPGIKPARKRAGEPKAHWFVRFGWIFGVIVGFGAVLLFPEQVRSWL